MRAGLLVMTMSLLLCGCSAVSIAEFKDGALYSMQGALVAADGNCSDADLRAQALSWSVRGLQDLRHRQRYLQEDSDAYLEVRELRRSISAITGRRVGNERVLCNKIAHARKATDQYFARNNPLQQISQGGL